MDDLESQDYDAQVRRAQAQVQQAEAQLANTVIRAPFTCERSTTLLASWGKGIKKAGIQPE